MTYYANFDPFLACKAITEKEKDQECKIRKKLVKEGNVKTTRCCINRVNEIGKN